jgi:hypothetical protein
MISQTAASPASHRSQVQESRDANSALGRVQYLSEILDFEHALASRTQFDADLRPVVHPAEL